jgi:hypothetical protein
MRRLIILLVVVGILAPAGIARADCAPKRHATTLANNRHATVIETRLKGSYADEQRTIVWGCLRGAHRWQRIVSTASDDYNVDDIKRVRLAGTKLAYAWANGSSRQDIYSGVSVYDLRARRHPTNIQAGYNAEIARVVLAKSGTVAYSLIEYDFEGDPPVPRRHRRVYRARGSMAFVIDDSLQIRLNTLKLDGSALTWLRDGKTRRLILR